jgi:hypothetical protein
MLLSEMSGFRRDVGHILAVLGFYAASIGTQLPSPQNNLLAPSSMAKRDCMTLGDGTDGLSHCIQYKPLPPYAA